MIHRGRVLGVVPKSYLPNYREFYEERQFRAAREAIGGEVELLGQTVPFGADILFAASDLPGFAVHVEICEDLWVPIPPSTYGALAGATVLVNLSASNITVGKADYRRKLCMAQSARCIAALHLHRRRPGRVDDRPGLGRAGADLRERRPAGRGASASPRRAAAARRPRPRALVADRAQHEQLRRLDRATTSDALRSASGASSFELGAGDEREPLRRTRRALPYVPADPASRDERCEEVYNIQVHGLEKRLRATGIKKVVIGVSGGLDSTHALIVVARAMDRLGLPRENVLAYTMPGFATSDHTKGNAWKLMEALGVTAREIDIRPSATQMLRDLEHPAADGEPLYDITFENVQAGERTSHLFRLANYHGALVVGTGDLSELALGWCTYGVGDQMSHYNVNASVPKTLIGFILRWVIDTEQFEDDVNEVLQSMLDTEISPELVPAEADKPTADSESKVGPYELQDFFLYYILRFGYRPSKVAFLAEHAWGDRDRGPWPDLIPPERRNEYSLSEIKHWLAVFLERFFHISQFKRTAIPNAPKVGSGGSLSPRGDWRAPSDSAATVWLDELRENVPD